MATCDWVKETVSHIIKIGMAEISTLEKLLHGHVDVSVIENGEETLSFTDRNHSISLTEQCTNDERERSVEKSTSRQRSGKGAIRKRLPLQKPRWEKTKLTIRYLYHENIS